jgi:hypothetical protein
MRAVADAIFEEPRLAEIYDDLDPDRGLKVIAADPAAACLDVARRKPPPT